MSLAYTILGFLNIEPMTGYDLKKNMDYSTQFIWHAKLSQIYPTLKQLEAKGLAEVEVVPQEGKPDKKVYSITEAGRQALIAWLNEPLDVRPLIKNPLLLRLFFLGVLDKEDILSQLRCQLEAQRARLKYLQQAKRIIQKAAQTPGLAQQALMWDLLNQLGELQMQTTIQWFEKAILVVEEKLRRNYLVVEEKSWRNYSECRPSYTELHVGGTEARRENLKSSLRSTPLIPLYTPLWWPDQNLES
jgi:PadR family transcriptional regulator AphA